jgi:hypothetical protein
LRRHSPHPTTSARSLARKDSEECAPCRITDGLCQVMILEKPFDIQILNGLLNLWKESIR